MWESLEGGSTLVRYVLQLLSPGLKPNTFSWYNGDGNKHEVETVRKEANLSLFLGDVILYLKAPKTSILKPFVW